MAVNQPRPSYYNLTSCTYFHHLGKNQKVSTDEKQSEEHPFDHEIESLKVLHVC